MRLPQRIYSYHRVKIDVFDVFLVGSLLSCKTRHRWLLLKLRAVGGKRTFHPPQCLAVSLTYRHLALASSKTTTNYCQKEIYGHG